jgi:hypothetical protein
VKLRGLLLLCVVIAAVTVPAAAPASADSPALVGPSLVGTVGPGFTIFLKDASGAAVTHLDPGTYELTVHDLADIHDFHLSGGNGAVNVATDVEFVGDQTFTVTLVDGTYAFYCDPHIETMRGSFTVGTATGGGGGGGTTPPAKKLYGSVSAAGKAFLGTSPGTRAKTVKAGSYVLSVKDASKRAGFRLSGPGVSRSTTGAFTGTVTWKLTLKKGATYRYGAGLSVRAL